jgi:putative transcriptional regulator
MDINYNFFGADNNLEPKKGRILISEPFLMDNYFKRSIVLLTEHNEEGTVGFVLNKPIEVNVHEVIENFPEFDFTLSLGGPVNTNSLHFIHTLGDIIPDSVKVLQNIYWGGDFDVVEKLIKSGNISNEQIRFFLGYSGWHPEQLENEISEDAWIVTKLSPEEIMTPMNKLFWKRKLRGMGKKYEMWSNFPENPQMN